MFGDRFECVGTVHAVCSYGRTTGPALDSSAIIS